MARFGRIFAHFQALHGQFSIMAVGDGKEKPRDTMQIFPSQPSNVNKIAGPVFGSCFRMDGVWVR